MRSFIQKGRDSFVRGGPRSGSRDQRFSTSLSTTDEKREGETLRYSFIGRDEEGEDDTGDQDDELE